MTFGQLFTQMHPDIRVKENGTCVWLYIDDVNHYTFGADWWNAEIKGQQEIVRCKDCRKNMMCEMTIGKPRDWYCADGEVKRE